MSIGDADSDDKTESTGYDEVSLEGITLVPDPTEKLLNGRQRVDYEAHRRSLLEWCLAKGKAPDDEVGYAHSTVKRRATRLDEFYRWVWNERRGYTTTISHDDADAYVESLGRADFSQSHKANCVKAVSTYFDWKECERGGDTWESERTFTEGSEATRSDYFASEERRALREAALEYGSVPHYNSLSATERMEWKRVLAQRFQMPVRDVGPEQFERANGFKIPSLVFTSLDAGLRPAEVERAQTTWVDTAQGVLRIPREDSVKEDDEWVTALQSRTVTMLERWLDERKLYEKYEDTDTLWLTREENPYQCASLSYLLDNLCEEAGIDTEHRDVSWYSIRRGMITEMIDATDLSTAKDQARHNSIKSTARYDQVPPERRRNALDKMG